jgi:hypothetical protein
MKLSKTIIALLGVLLLGATAAFAWSGTGTGTGTCTERSIGEKDDPSLIFHPFAVWSGYSLNGFFYGTWVDKNHSGTFSGSYYAPGQFSTERVSVGHWYMSQDDGGGGTMGTYELHMDIWSNGNAHGTWLVPHPDWIGSGDMTGDDPNIPPQEEE